MIFNYLHKRYENQSFEIQKKAPLLAVFIAVFFIFILLTHLLLLLTELFSAEQSLIIFSEFILLIVAFWLLHKGRYVSSVNLVCCAVLISLLLRMFFGVEAEIEKMPILTLHILVIVMVMAFFGTSKKQVGIISSIGLLLILLYLNAALIPSVRNEEAIASSIVFFLLFTGFGFMLFYVYQNSIHKTEELIQVNMVLKEEIKKREVAENEIKVLGGLLPICSKCKKIRDDKGYWNQIESYICDHSEADFSHSICPECARKLYPDLDLSA